MRASAEMRTLDAWYDHLDVDQILEWFDAEVTAKRLGKKEAKEAARTSRRRGRATTSASLAKRTGEIDGQLRIVAEPPLIVPIEDLAARHAREEIEESMRQLIQSYRRTLATPPPPDRGVRLRPRGAQGRRRRQRRDAGA